MGPYDASMSSSGSNSSSSSAGEAPDQIDGLLAGSGYRVRSSELRHVAQWLERLENVMVNAPAEVSTSSLFLLLFIVSLVASNRRPLSLCRPCIVIEAAVVPQTNVDAATAADKLGEDFYKVILEEEPFKSTTVRSILKSYRWAPFLPVATDSSMLSVLLLLSKYRLRNVPVIEPGQPSIKNFITQSAVIQRLDGCRGRDWFDFISAQSVSDLGLPFMSSNEVVSIQSNELILEAFKKMKDYHIGGLPVIEGPNKKIIGNVSIRDIRHLLLKPQLFSNFRQLTVMDFMNTVVSTTHDTGRVITPITCKLGSTLGSVIYSLASKSVHRIYVVTPEENEVVGVITLRDVISCFIHEPPNHFDNYFGFAVQEMLSQ